MYAIVEMAGQQFKVAKDQKVFVHRLPGKEGDKVTFDKVLLLDDGKVTIGAPAIAGAAVTAKFLGHLKGDKVIVFNGVKLITIHSLCCITQRFLFTGNTKCGYNNFFHLLSRCVEYNTNY